MRSIWRPDGGVEWAILVCLVLIVILVVFAEESAQKFDHEHGCVPTGASRVSSYIHVDDMLVPLYAYEKRCETGEVVWR